MGGGAIFLSHADFFKSKDETSFEEKIVILFVMVPLDFL